MAKARCTRQRQAAVEEEELDTPEEQSREELEQLLEEAVENEDYELAARLRDKLDKLK